MFWSQSCSILCWVWERAVSCRTETAGGEAKGCLGDQFSALWIIPDVAPVIMMELQIPLSMMVYNASVFSFFHLSNKIFSIHFNYC